MEQTAPGNPNVFQFRIRKEGSQFSQLSSDNFCLTNHCETSPILGMSIIGLVQPSLSCKDRHTENISILKDI